MKWLFSIALLWASLASAEVPPHLLYLAYKGQISQALDLYLQHVRDAEGENSHLLIELAKVIIDTGIQSEKVEDQIMALYGAGIANHTSLLPVLEKGMRSTNPQMQQVAIGFLARFQDDVADNLLLLGLSSPYLPIRMETAFHLAQKRHPDITVQIAALLAKVHPQLRPLFPQLLAPIGTVESTTLLRQMFTDVDPRVRIEAVLSAARAQRDDLLPQIRALASHPDIAQQEACARALGELRDSDSMEQLRKIARSGHPHSRIAALASLVHLGEESALAELSLAARREELFAIPLLGDLPQEASIGTLLLLLRAKDLNTRLNATLALLRLRHPACIHGLQELLIRDSRDLIFQEVVSPGHSLKAWKAIPSALQKMKKEAPYYAFSLALRETWLTQALELPEADFLFLAEQLFVHNQTDLVPLLVQLLQNQQTPGALALLREGEQRVGSPLIRYYCTLALFRLHGEEVYGRKIQKWVAEQQNLQMIRFRDLLPAELRATSSLLTPEEASRLLIESIEALAKWQDREGIYSLLQAIAHGHPSNRYALAGLLMRAVE